MSEDPLTIEALRARLRALERRHEILYRAAQGLQMQTTLSGRLAVVATAARDLAGGGMVSIALSDATDGSLEWAYASGSPAAEDLVGRRMAPGEGLTGRVAASQQPVRTDDLQTDPRASYRAFNRAWGWRSWLGVPLQEAQQVIGVLAIARLEREPFTDEDEQALGSLGALAGAALREARLIDGLRASEERFRTLVERLPEAIYRLRPDGSPEFLSSRLGEMLGVDIAPLVADPPRWRDVIHPEDVERVIDIWLAASRAGAPFRREFRVVRPDGNVRWLEERAEPALDVAGQVLHYDGLIIDVTDRKRTQEELAEAARRARLLSESLLEVVYEADLTRAHRPTGVSTFYSGNVERILGISPEAAYADDAHWLNGLHPDDRERAVAAHEELLKSGETQDLEYRWIKPSGEVIWLEDRARLERGPDGKPLVLRGTLADVTARKELEQRIAETDKLRALGTMAAGVAHDFNNLLALVIGRADLALVQLTAGAVERGALAEALREIVQAAEDGAATVRRLQSYVRQQPESAGEPFDLGEAVRLAIHLAAPRWRDEPRRHGATISLQSDLPDGLWVTGDAVAIRQAVTNLLFNAVDAMPEGGQIVVRAVGVGGLAVLTVEDTGQGMPEHVRRQCLHPFFTTKGARGTGLGLAEVYGAMKRHGGDLDLESAPGKGTRVTLRLPLTQGVLAPPAAPAAAATGSPGMRVLVVDDEPGLTQLLATMLRSDGHHVEVADGGAEAVRMLEAEEFDAVITDLGMPDVGGWDVARSAKRKSPAPLVILATGWGATLVPDEARAAGVDVVVPKPYRIAEMRQALERVSSALPGGLNPTH